jgi:hypothetical protein
LPDGLIEVHRAGVDRPELFVLEMATYPERRLLEQVVRDLTLVYLDRRELPEVLALILCPKGNYRVDDSIVLRSPRGWTTWRVRIKVVELWTLPAEDLLRSDDVGVIPWVPLSRIEGPPEPILRACIDRIEADAPPELRENLLAVTQVLSGLRYNDPSLLNLFLGGRASMLKLPFIEELLSDRDHKRLLRVLTTRFGPGAERISPELATITDDDALDQLFAAAAGCSTLDAFRERLRQVVASLPVDEDDGFEDPSPSDPR